MDIDVIDAANRLKASSNIEYWNNSPDTLQKLFFHLYWNAFQPNSSMDVRSKELGKTVLGTDKKGNPHLDWDGRVRDRIGKLTPEQIGFQKITVAKVNGQDAKLIEHETILELRLQKPILPKSKSNIDLSFETQVPVQIRRAGRDNAEGVRFSMSQWYPKMVEYDYQGWNANPYVAREFYGVWGDYDVKIAIDKNFTVAGTGILQNSGPDGKPVATTEGKRLWHLKAENVHDFVWAADTAYVTIGKQLGPVKINVCYKKGNARTDSLWQNVLWSAEKVLPFIEARFGKYPYPQYSFIQGGDGGMEYAQATLLRGPGLGGVFHEWMHNWYQHLLGTNESLFAWMDEGFTTYATEEVEDHYYRNYAPYSPYSSKTEKEALAKNMEAESKKLPLKHSDSYESYFELAASPYEEAMTTHADHFNTNYGYSQAAYNKGAVFLNQLGYIIGDSLLEKTLHAYYDQWKYKHPNANDFIRVAEKSSGLALQWYKEYWVYGTKTIDYAIGNIDNAKGGMEITLKRVGKMPMPIDVLVTFKDGMKEWHHVPLNLCYGNKQPSEAGSLPWIVHTEWKWTHPEYKLSIPRQAKEIKSVEIDPTGRLADVRKENNRLVVPD